MKRGEAKPCGQQYRYPLLPWRSRLLWPAPFCLKCIAEVCCGCLGFLYAPAADYGRDPSHTQSPRASMRLFKHPLRTEWEAAGRPIQNYPWIYEYDYDLFRSRAEVEWAKTFDLLGLPWESEPLKFDMGPKHVSYTPDFRVTGLSIPGSNRPLYLEVQRFPDEVDLTKYVRFTGWYNCDLLVLAHMKGGVLRPKKEKYFLI